MRYGTNGPAWLTALQLAEAWGEHPQDIMEREGGITWAARWVVYQKARERIRKLAEKKK